MLALGTKPTLAQFFIAAVSGAAATGILIMLTPRKENFIP